MTPPTTPAQALPTFEQWASLNNFRIPAISGIRSFSIAKFIKKGFSQERADKQLAAAKKRYEHEEYERCLRLRERLIKKEDKVREEARRERDALAAATRELEELAEEMDELTRRYLALRSKRLQAESQS